MRIEQQTTLESLECIRPTDPSGEDEPYLWTFHFTVDGSTIQQHPTDPTRIIANVTMQPGSGFLTLLTGYNLAEELLGIYGEVRTRVGGVLRVPPQLGTFRTQLRPIPLNVPGVGRVFGPGGTITFCMLTDHDGTPSNVRGRMWADLIAFLPARLNTLLTGYNFGPAITRAGLNTNQLFQEIFADITGILIPTLRREAQTRVMAIAIADIVDKNTLLNFFDNIAPILDPDEPVGSAMINSNEQQHFAVSFATTSLSEMIRSDRDPLVRVAHYILRGTITAEFVTQNTDIVLQAEHLDSATVITKTHTFDRDRLCIAAGTQIEWKLLHNFERFDLHVEYPFATYKYLIDGVELARGSGSIKIQTDISIPEFAPDSYKFIRSKSTAGNATVSYRMSRPANDPQIEHLFLENDPAEGNFSFTVEVRVILPNGTEASVGSRYFHFGGQSIDLPKEFLKNVAGCLAPFTGTKYSISKDLAPKDLWGPTGLKARYDRISDQVTALAAVRGFDDRTLAAIKDEVAVQLGIKVGRH